MTRKWLGRLALLIGFLGSSMMISEPAAAAKMVLGWIVLDPSVKGQIRVSGKVYCPSAFDGRYSLQIDRQSGGGRAKTGQKGAIELKAGEEKGLSVTSVNVAPGDKLVVTLDIFENGVLISSSRMTAGGGGEKDI